MSKKQDKYQKYQSPLAERYASEEMSYNFSDQLKMAVRFSPDKLLVTANQLRDAEKDYVRPYAAYVCRAIDNAQ